MAYLVAIGPRMATQAVVSLGIRVSLLIARTSGSCPGIRATFLLSNLALNTANARAEIPTRFARQPGERTAVINCDIFEVRRICKIAINRCELAVAGGCEMASRVDDTRQSR